MGQFFGDDFEEQIRKSVSSSANWINDVIDDIHAGVANQMNNVARTKSYQDALQERARVQAERQRQLQEKTRLRNELNSRMKPVSTGGNFFRTIWQGFSGLFTVASFSVFLDDLASGYFTRAIITFAMTFAFGLAFVSTTKKKRQIKRFAKYVTYFGHKTYIEIAEMEATFGYSHKTIIKDIRKMVAEGILKQAHVDLEEKYLMLTDEVYNQYLDSQSSYNARMEVEKLKAQEEEEAQRKANGGKDPEVVKALQQGKEYIAQIRKANEVIPGEEISKKLARLEEVSGQIFAAVDKHPEKLTEIRKFMDYYMPTTLKLVNSYHEFDMQRVQGDNIKKAKKEIEDTLDMINMAFENLSDRLYEADTMDVTADISVLKTLLEQEGLRDNDFKL